MYFEDDIENCVRVLNDGGIILYPTETVWGIGCDPTNEQAISKIFKLKQRNESKSMIILVAEEDDILNYTNQGTVKFYDYLKGISKPTTVIYQHAKNLSEKVIAEDGSVAIRVVKDKFCKELIKLFGKPLVSTSSNISGFPSPTLFTDIDILIKSGVDYIVHHRQDETEPGQPSAIVKINDDGSYITIRP
jgi:L-threonylcarbamoyladenylate synthase